MRKAPGGTLGVFRDPCQQHLLQLLLLLLLLFQVSVQRFLHNRCLLLPLLLLLLPEIWQAGGCARVTVNNNKECYYTDEAKKARTKGEVCGQKFA